MLCYMFSGSDLAKSLWDLICIETWKYVNESSSMKNEDLCQLAATYFVKAYTIMPTVSWWNDKLFRHFSKEELGYVRDDGVKWPLLFDEYVKNVKLVDMKSDWAKTYIIKRDTNEVEYKEGYNEGKVAAIWLHT